MTHNNEFIDTLLYFQSGNKQSDAKEKCGMRQAFAEVFILLEHFDNSIKRLIPKSFVMYLYDNMDAAWRGRIDFTKKLNDMELLKETRVLLSLIYRDFVCTDEERKELVEADRSELKKAGMEHKDMSLRELFKVSY